MKTLKLPDPSQARTAGLVIGLVALAIGSCRTPPTTTAPPAADPPRDAARALAQQGADAVLYQAASAEAYRLYQQGYELARMRLDENLKYVYMRPPCVIVDVDETVLDNSPYEITNIAQGRGYDSTTWNGWVRQARARALPGAVKFLQYAASRSCEVFYITNREMQHKAATVANLKDSGFPMADDVHVLPMIDGHTDKTERRKQISWDYDIKLVVGDQLRDFDEAFKDRWTDHGRPTVEAMRDTLQKYFILLPNPMYGTWRDAISGKGGDGEKLQNVERFFQEHAY